ncbi:MAG: DUF3016 domain-containing protein [Proteobacteria bacterium]|nr:DUF3016 domain-containing protein [Pseudomonadota bacterium]
MQTHPRTIFRSLIVVAAACLALAACAAPGLKKPLPDRVQVNWAPNDQLSEVRNNPSQRGWQRPEEWQKALSDNLRRHADLVLPPGQKLDVKVEDIKLAGDFEPWRGPNALDIRFMKDIYPPRATLHYKLSGANGATIREGDSKITDLSYLHRTTNITSIDPLRYDKRMLDDWIDREFGKNKP